MYAHIVQIGDGHFAPGPRNADRYRALDQIIDEGLRLAALGAWVWPGDIFDGLSTTEDRNELDKRLIRMAAVAPVILDYGNHDRKGDLEGFANLNGTYPIVVVSRPQIVRVLLPPAFGGAYLSAYCFPYPHKGGLVSAGVAHGDVVQTADQLITPIFTKAGDELAKAKAAGDRIAFFFHANIKGALTSAGQPNIGKEIELTASHLALLGDCYKGGNHIHLPQELFGAYFAGSIAAKDYGEKERKRYLVIDIEDDSRYTVHSRPLNGLLMVHLNAHVDLDAVYFEDEENDDGDPEIRRRLAANEWADCDVRLRATFNESQKPALNFDALKARFASSGRFKFEPIVIPDRQLRAPGVAAMRTLPAKLAAMRSESELPASVADKLAALEQLDASEVLLQVDTWLTDVQLIENAKQVVAA